MVDKVQKHNSFNTNTPSSESYRNDLCIQCSFPIYNKILIHNLFLGYVTFLNRAYTVHMIIIKLMALPDGTC
jgi:hypothetical protein